MKSLSTDFGVPLVLAPAGWRVSRLAEEHCFLERVKAAGREAAGREATGREAAGHALRPGDRIELVPSHGCTTINLHDAYHVTRKGMLAAVWPIAARGKAT
jgi:D-serine deaminase-like pyridoxal phosphate-dependent protein